MKDFGAIGSPLLNRGSISANSNRLKLDDPGQGETALGMWKEGSGIAVDGAGEDGKYPHVTRIAKGGMIDDHNFILETPAPHDAQSALVSSDDSLPIQAAIDSLDSQGGTVFVPVGIYIIGTRGRKPTFGESNQALLIGSNTRLVGAGRGATVLRLPNDVRQKRKLVQDPKCQSFDASIFVNRANGWFQDPLPPPDSRLEIAHMTLDGNKGGQTFLFGRDNMTDPSIGDPQENALTADLGPDVLNPPPNALVWNKGYAFAVSYTGDNPDRETLAAGYYFVKMPNQLGHKGSPSVTLRLPPTPPGAKNVVVYVATDDPNPCLGGPFREYHDQHYERQPPVPVPDPDPNDKMNRPSLVIDRHSPPPDPAFLPPGILTQFPGESSLSSGVLLDNVTHCYLHDLEVRNFVTDGLGLSTISDCLFDAVWTHHNGRHGVGSGGLGLSLRFVDCWLDSNASTGCDLEGRGFQDIHFLNCRFEDNGTGLSLGPAPPDKAEPSMFGNISVTNCDFNHNFQHIFTVVSPNSIPITNLRLVGCTFRYSLSFAVCISSAGYGAIMACDFDQNTRPPSLPPDYNWQSRDTVSQLTFQYPASNWHVIGNRFRPFVSVNGRTATDGAMTQGTNNLTSATAAFNASDVGWPITVGGAGPTGAALRTTIIGFIDSATVTVFKAASTTVSGVKVTIGDGQKKASGFAAVELEGCLGMIISSNHFDLNPHDPDPGERYFVNIGNVRAVSDVAMTQDSNTLTSTLVAFNAGTDMGRPITVRDDKGTVVLSTIIVDVIDGKRVTVLDAASKTVSKGTVTINRATRAANILSDNTVATSGSDDHAAAYLDDGSGSGPAIVSATERRVRVVQAEQLSVPIVLAHPMAGPDYKVQVALHWNAGALWITDKRTDGFTIHWEKAPPKVDQQQEHVSGFLDYLVYL